MPPMHIDPQWCMAFFIAAFAAIGHIRLERNRTEAKEDRRKITELEEEVKEVTGDLTNVKIRLVAVEQENSTLRTERDLCRERVMSLLSENIELRKENTTLRAEITKSTSYKQ